MSSSSVTIQTQAVIFAYQSSRAYVTCGLAAIAIYVYDYVLCLGRESQYVWQSGKSTASRLVYLYISCSVLGWVTFCMLFLSLIGPAMLTTLRTYVLSGRNKVVCGVALILGLAPFIVNASTANKKQPANLPPPENCVDQYTGSAALDVRCEQDVKHVSNRHSSQTVVIVARSCTILADLLAIVVTWRATRNSHQVLRGNSQQPSLHHVMWKNGNIYFVTLLLANLLDLILVTLSIAVPQNQGSYVISFLDPLNSILNCRFLLDLYETNARLERGGSSLSQSHLDLSLHFSHSEGADGPDNSPFLSSFAGPILHTFPEDDMDVDVVSVARSEGEVDSEPVLPVAGPISLETAA